MEETRLTIIGMIAAFVTASITPLFVESVREYVNHKAKLQDLRIALYKEMLLNYFIVRLVVGGNDPTDKTYISHTLRTECYRHALQNELFLFYQLNEATEINILQGIAGGYLLNNDTDEDLKAFALRFEKSFEKNIYRGWFDKKTCLQIMSKSMYQKLVDRGKEAVMEEEEYREHAAL